MRKRKITPGGGVGLVESGVCVKNERIAFPGADGLYFWIWQCREKGPVMKRKREKEW